MGLSRAVFDLERFVNAQDGGGTYRRAVDELRAERKTSHWMWFVLPQIAGLGSSPTARRYGVSGLDEARAYLAHPVLGPRLLECVAIVVSAAGRDAHAIFGGIDEQKLQSSMTLFARADPDQPAFTSVLEKFFGGRPDEATDRMLAASG